jgi:ankyrin repeat protein
MLEALCTKRHLEKLNFISNSKGLNAIMFAASVNNWEAVEYLSDLGIITDVEDQEGSTLLIKVLEAG